MLGTKKAAAVYTLFTGAPMQRAEEYRKKAADCLALARLVSDQEERLGLERIAHAYLSLAQLNERDDGKRRPNSAEKPRG
jgi:hypothetical protein